MTQREISPWIQNKFSQWLTQRAETQTLALLGPVRIEEFDAIYRLAVRDTLRLTSSLGPHLDTLRRLLDLAESAE